MIYSWCAAIAQLVERIHGKDEVTGSSPVGGSIFFVIFCHNDRGRNWIRGDGDGDARCEEK